MYSAAIILSFRDPLLPVIVSFCYNRQFSRAIVSFIVSLRFFFSCVLDWCSCPCYCFFFFLVIRFFLFSFLVLSCHPYYCFFYVYGSYLLVVLTCAFRVTVMHTTPRRCFVYACAVYFPLRHLPPPQSRYFCM